MRVDPLARQRFRSEHSLFLQVAELTDVPVGERVIGLVGESLGQLGQ